MRAPQHICNRQNFMSATRDLSDRPAVRPPQHGANALMRPPLFTDSRSDRATPMSPICPRWVNGFNTIGSCQEGAGERTRRMLSGRGRSMS
jgi:hypothetical protein